MKRPKLIILPFLMITLLFAPILSVRADNPQISIMAEHKSSVQSGETVEIKVKMTGYSSVGEKGINGMSVYCDLMPKKYEYVTGSVKSLLKTSAADTPSVSYNSEKKRVVLLYINMSISEKGLSRTNSDILSFSIKIADDAADGMEIDIPITVEMFFGNDNEPTPVTVSPIKITVSDIPSDIENSTTTVSETQTNGTVVVDINDEDRLPWDSVVVDGGSSKDITVEKTPNGLIVRGKDMDEVKITVEKDGKKTEIKVKPEEDSFIITDDIGDEPAVYNGTTPAEDSRLPAKISPLNNSPSIRVIIIAASAAAVVPLVIGIAVYTVRKRR